MAGPFKDEGDKGPGVFCGGFGEDEASGPGEVGVEKEWGTGEVPRLGRVLATTLELVRRREEAPNRAGRDSVLIDCML